MPLLGGRKNMMPDTTLKTPLIEGQNNGTNMNIEEDKIFSKGKPEKKAVTLDIEPIIEEEEDTQPLLEEPSPEVPQKKKQKGRPKVSDERREEVRKERAARLVAGRAKSLEKRRENALKKKAEAGRIAQQRLGQQYQQIPVPAQTAPTPAPTPVPTPGPIPQQQPLTHAPVNNVFDYDKIINGVYNRMEMQSSSIDEQALLDYGDKIRLQEQEKAKLALKDEYEKINKVRGRYEQMNNAVNLLGQGANTYKANHRVFGRRPGGSRNGRNNFAFQ